MKRAPEAAAETGRAAGLVLRSSRGLTQKLQLLEDEVSVFVAGMRAALRNALQDTWYFRVAASTVMRKTVFLDMNSAVLDL
ncbi:hypothetical protein [Bradyrhizobium centrosematis]|uniref:hypothetical protein n=1 Tax=Bradyrhizobium centrosematis TaxID=1300039 RepID=UPI00388D5191